MSVTHPRLAVRTAKRITKMYILCAFFVIKIGEYIADRINFSLVVFQENLSIRSVRALGLGGTETAISERGM